MRERQDQFAVFEIVAIRHISSFEYDLFIYEVVLRGSLNEQWKRLEISTVIYDITKVLPIGEDFAVEVTEL